MEVEVFEPEPPPKKITITLNEEEAAALFAILSEITGSCKENNPREVVATALWQDLNSKLGFFKGYKYLPIVEKYVVNIEQGMNIG